MQTELSIMHKALMAANVFRCWTSPPPTSVYHLQPIEFSLKPINTPVSYFPLLP